MKNFFLTEKLRLPIDLERKDNRSCHTYLCMSDTKVKSLHTEVQAQNCNSWGSKTGVEDQFLKGREILVSEKNLSPIKRNSSPKSYSRFEQDLVTKGWVRFAIFSGPFAYTVTSRVWLNCRHRLQSRTKSQRLSKGSLIHLDSGYGR